MAKRGSSETFRSAAFSPDGAKLYALAWHKSEEAGHTFYVWDSFDTPRRQVLLTWDLATGKLLNEWDPAPVRSRVWSSNLVGLTMFRPTASSASRLWARYTDWHRSIAASGASAGAISMSSMRPRAWLAQPAQAGPVAQLASIAGGKELLTFQKEFNCPLQRAIGTAFEAIPSCRVRSLFSNSRSRSHDHCSTRCRGRRRPKKVRCHILGRCHRSRNPPAGCGSQSGWTLEQDCFLER